MTADLIPRCEHGRILLACPDDDCAVQNTYLERQHAAMDDWSRRLTDEARKLVRRTLGMETP